MMALWHWLRTTFHLGPDVDSSRAVRRQLHEVRQTVKDVQEARQALQHERAALPSVGEVLAGLRQPEQGGKP